MEQYNNYIIPPYQQRNSVFGVMGTLLPLRQKIGYQLDKSLTRPYDTGYDYDLRGFYNKYKTLQPHSTNRHLTDEFKYVIHPTFSNESKFYNGQSFAIDWSKFPYEQLSEYGIL